MLLFHGSEEIIYKPEYGLGKQSNDYGRGFYCTENREIAAEWACKRDRDGFINCYDMDLKGLKICDLNDDKHNILNWLALLTCYRGYWQRKSIAEEAKDHLRKHYLIDISGFDIIRGYRADDSYFSFAQDFIMGTISLQKLSAAMRLGKLGEQIVLKSRKAFEHISFVSAEAASAELYYKKKKERDAAARRDYSSERPKASRVNEIYILDIMRGTVKDDELFL
ncbi:MAG: DUF3990 domain-containing protein [Lachnospiraceae bacterium]|nr:DUF3990 domain-containing protein [Lachnospiraceae bacterium]